MAGENQVFPDMDHIAMTALTLSRSNMSVASLVQSAAAKWPWSPAATLVLARVWRLALAQAGADIVGMNQSAPDETRAAC